MESAAVRRGRLLAGGILAGFFILAFTFALLVSRSLQRQIDAFLQAARRLGSGDFTVEVPTEGHDEFAALGEEFNKMSRQLEERLEELNQERGRLQDAMRRIGETFAANLDREGLLEIVVRTAVDGVGADAGRASVRPNASAPLEQVALTGSVDGLEEAVRAAEAKVLETGEPCEATVDGVGALSHPMRRGDDVHARVSGVVSVARRERPFSVAERELFHYLAEQAAVSIENVGLHETVERQAVTDELTGLFNRRRFQEVDGDRGRALQALRPAGGPGAARPRRLQGRQRHLRPPAGRPRAARGGPRAARDLARDRRAGALRRRGAGRRAARHRPRGRLQPGRARARGDRGAVAAAARRRGHAGRDRELRGGDPAGLAPTTCEELVAAADEALYRAKRAGKNRTVRAEASPQL